MRTKSFIAAAALALCGMSADAALTTWTNPDGSFLFPLVPDGTYAQTVTKQATASDRQAVSSLDSSLVLQAVVGKLTLTPEQQVAADVNGDGVVSALDSSLILQYVVGTLKRFPVAEKCGSDFAYWQRSAGPPKPGQCSATTIVSRAGATAPAAPTRPAKVSARKSTGRKLWARRPGVLRLARVQEDIVAVMYGDVNASWAPAAIAAASTTKGQ